MEKKIRRFISRRLVSHTAINHLAASYAYNRIYYRKNKTMRQWRLLSDDNGEENQAAGARPLGEIVTSLVREVICYDNGRVVTITTGIFDTMFITHG